jgi:hypothetical protein
VKATTKHSSLEDEEALLSRVLFSTAAETAAALLISFCVDHIDRKQIHSDL